MTGPVIAWNTYGMAGLVLACPQVDGLWTVIRCEVRRANVKVMERNTGPVDPVPAAVSVGRKVIGMIWAVARDRRQLISVQWLDGTANAGMGERRGRSGRRDSGNAGRGDECGYRKCSEPKECPHDS